MDAAAKYNINVVGTGSETIVCAHGFGCDQTAWHYLRPLLQERFRLVLFDYIGAGKSDAARVEAGKYGTLDGYVGDLIEVCDSLGLKAAVFMGHSVSCMIGMLTSIRRPELFSRMIMIGPSPRYINDHDYPGGFERETIDTLMYLMEKDFISWAKELAPVIMNTSNGEPLCQELVDNFCRVDPEIARQFAHATFYGDNRDDLRRCPVPSRSILCRNDSVSPLAVAKYVELHTPGNTLELIEGSGHCPHMSHPAETARLINEYLGQS